jgi:hypothetical protein
MLVNRAPGTRRMPHFTLILPSYLQKKLHTSPTRIYTPFPLEEEATGINGNDHLKE